MADVVADHVDNRLVATPASPAESLLAASAVGLVSVGAFAEVDQRAESEAPTQPRQLCDHALLGCHVDVAAEFVPNTSSATPTLAAPLFATSCTPASCSFVRRATFLAALTPSPAHYLIVSSSMIVTAIVISCTSSIVTMMTWMVMPGVGSHTPSTSGIQIAGGPVGISLRRGAAVQRVAPCLNTVRPACTFAAIHADGAPTRLQGRVRVNA